MKTKLLFIFLLACKISFSQDLISDGSNKWIFHTPDDGRTTMFVAPWIGNDWAWGSSTQFLNNGGVNFSGTITTQGHIGIGIAPLYSLHTVSYNNTSAASAYLWGQYYGATVGIQNTDPNYYAFLVQNGINENGSGGNSLFVVRGNGNTGIGTYSPGYKLDVNGTFHVAEGNNSKIDLGSWGHTFYFTDGTVNRISFSTWRTNPSGSNLAGIGMFDEDGTTQKVFIASAGISYFNGGNVGIGTDNPTSKLSVNGNVTIGGHIYSKQRIDISDYGSNDDLFVRFNNKAALAHFNTQGDYNLYINVDWTESQGFHPDFASGVIIGGKVSIGTNATPQNALDVNGTIRAKEVKVAVGWADFVFHPTYQLKPLAEVEQFIKTNGHLESIPSAKEVEQNGVSLGNMQAKLLQKVEELTLYTIEQDKKLKEQEKKNASLEQEVKELRELINNKLK